jgi:hypothetical protein
LEGVGAAAPQLREAQADADATKIVPGKVGCTTISDTDRPAKGTPLPNGPLTTGAVLALSMR